MKHQKSLKFSFKYATNGVWYFFLHERNGRIELCFAIAVILIGIGFKISNLEWLSILLSIGLIVSAEMMNSAIERLCDIVQEEYHPIIKVIKDMAAGAVLTTTFFSAITGCIIFIPKIINYIL